MYCGLGVYGFWGLTSVQGTVLGSEVCGFGVEGLGLYMAFYFSYLRASPNKLVYSILEKYIL